MSYKFMFETGAKDTTVRPVLVYGTLRNGEGNWRHLIANKPHVYETVRVPGFDMYSNGGFPYIIPSVDASAEIVAELVTFTGNPEDWESFLEGLDRLEGYMGEGVAHNHYNRVIVNYIKDDGSTDEAYVYVAASPDAVTGLRKIENGDWMSSKDSYSMFRQ